MTKLTLENKRELLTRGEAIGLASVNDGWSDEKLSATLDKAYARISAEYRFHSKQDRTLAYDTFEHGLLNGYQR